MPGRLGTIVDEASGKLREGAVTKVDDMTVKITLTKPDIALIPSLCDYPGADRPPLVRRDRRGLRQEPDRHRSVRARLLRCRPEGGLQAPRERQVVEWRGLSRWRRVHRLRHRSVGDGLGLRGRRSPHQPRDDGRLCDDPRRRRRRSPRKSSPPSTIVARTNVANKPYDDQKVRNALQLAVDNAVVLQLGYGNAGAPAENHHVCADPSGICRAAQDRPRLGEGEGADGRSRPGRLRARADHGRRGLAQEHRRRDRRADPRSRHQGQAHRAAGFDLLERLDEVSLLDDQLEHASARRPGARHRLSHRRGLERGRLFQPRVRCQGRRGARRSPTPKSARW